MVKKWKIGPIEKVYEAFSAISDQRIEMHDDYAWVKSSDHAKTYTVEWQDDVYTSNDNASYWQGYYGYPVIAVLLMQEKLMRRDDIIQRFQNINWHELNQTYKRDYALAADKVLDDRFSQEEQNDIRNYVESLYDTLKELPLFYQRASLKLAPKIE